MCYNIKKMKGNTYTVLITASGTSAKLGDFTKYTNKTLIRIGGKPAISYIIEQYPKNTHFVITLGHFADQVRDFLKLMYPKHTFTFVTVNKYEGKGSSLGYSMLQAAPHLQKPFIYHASDTVVNEKIPKPTSNWIGGFQGMGSSNYTSFNILNGKIQKILDKGIIDPDYLHIGLVGVYSFKFFWKYLQELYKGNQYGENLSDFHALNEMIVHGTDFSIKEYHSWYDIGNVDSLQVAREKLRDPFQILDKPKESIYVMNKSVIKFFSDPKMIEQRVKRAKILGNLVPKIKGYTKNYYTYDFVRGDLYADIANPANFPDFLYWSFKNFWKPIREVSDKEFKNICYNFYYTKTKERIQEFLKTRVLKDKETIINDEKIPSVNTLLKNIDFNYLADGRQFNFHGDFILDNIIKTKKGYTLLDWRQSFGGLLKAGDIYYDLAKLNHNLVINHTVVNNNLFTINATDENIICDILRKDSFVACQNILFDIIKEKELDTKRVKLLTAIAWLNMSPLHVHPYDTFLFYFGKQALWRTLNEN